MNGLNFKTVADAESGILEGVRTGFLHASHQSSEHIRPKFIYNDQGAERKSVLSVMKRELRRCKSFWFSVAFVTDHGLVVLKEVFDDLRSRGIKGRILTSTYLGFNSPKAFKELLKLQEQGLVEIRVLRDCLHAKGYMFNHGLYTNFLVGSANLTDSALQLNKEWNIRVSSIEDGSIVREANEEFERMWQKGEALTEEWIARYKESYVEKVRTIQSAKAIPFDAVQLTPNAMQEAALAGIAETLEQGAKKALLISATGTGKTYLSAFAARRFKAKKLLFIAHREQILHQAKESYRNVLLDSVTYGILSGSHKETDENYLFATIQTLSNEDVLHSFHPEEFDWICIDEVHKAGAKSYKKIFDYFKPKLFFGMTATPERSDGEDIYALFDHNVAYEIRLQQALEADLLCPFHYFGLSDIIGSNGESIENADFSMITGDERIQYIVEKAEYYGHSTDRVKGLVFCRTIEEANKIAEGFAKQGYRTKALSGADSQSLRQETIRRLELDDPSEYNAKRARQELSSEALGEIVNQSEGPLDYIFTVDLFNEGIDIPQVNQVIMLRPTESVIVFVQQLGRGLRKYHSKRKNWKGTYENKDYLVVLDFVSNYDKNFLIPIALSGDRSYDKDSVRRHVSEGEHTLAGSSTINFDRIAKERIYKAIDNANFKDLKILKEAYALLKQQLGRIPSLVDFEKYGSIDYLRFSEHKLGSYHAFLTKYEPDYKVKLSKEEENMLSFVSQRLAHGKWMEELYVLRALLEEEQVYLEKDARFSSDEEGEKRYQALLAVVENVLTNHFVTASNQKKTFASAIFVMREGAYFKRSVAFARALNNPQFAQLLRELLRVSWERWEKDYSHYYKDTAFVMNKKYTYEDVCRLLCWEKNIVALNIGGYKYDEGTNTFPVFINYHKADDIQDSIKYEDTFISDDHLLAYSKSNQTTTSAAVERIYKAEELGTRIYLFVRKNKDDKDSKSFYFLGDMKPTGQPEARKMPDGKPVTALYYHLQKPVAHDLYEYLTMENI